ncbi:MAG: MG2 domain-containing protein, partial [Chitinophagaceae bacterium]
MKSVQLFLLVLFFSVVNVSKAFCQQKNYDAEWKRVDALLKGRALPQSALAEVKKIYATAKKEGQDAQVIKALVYMTQLQQQTREEAAAKAIAEIEAEILKSRQPAASILNSYLAGLYWQYFQQSRWKIYERTATAGFDKKDIATWSADDFHNRITELYLQSLLAEKTLKATSLKAYDAIINKGNVRHLRPTLYDLLAHRALDYFKSGERDLNKPAYAFEITAAEAFAPAAQFVKTKFETRDTGSLKRQALLLYQDLIQFHLSDANKEALVDVDVDRIQFVYQHSVAEGKDSLYVAALQHIKQQHSTAAAAEAWYLLAAYYEALASTYEPFGDTTYRYHRIKAKEILERVVRDSTQKSAAWASSYNLLQQIQQPQFRFTIEKVTVPGQLFRALITYKNVPQLHFRLIKATDALKNNQNRYEEKYWNALLAAPAVKSWQQALPQTADLQEHRVEVKVDALPVGEYFLIASADAAFSKKKALLGAQDFYVSNISYINNNKQYFVLHRQSGQPLGGAIAHVYRQQYDYKTSRYTKVPMGKYTTDKNGFFQIAETAKENRGFTYYVDLSHNGDSLNMDEGMYQYHYYDDEVREPKKQTKIFFFTDRSIYRPGQTVYFKGIVVSSTGLENEILKDWKTKLYLQDANYEDADSLEVVTNEWGSFSGKFTLPQGGLNGRFRIYDEEENDEVSFSVEEYKRP